MPNTNQTLFIVIFSLIAVVIVLLTYVCWLKRMKMAAKRDLLYNQHQLERGQQQQQQYQLSATQLQQMKPVLLQQLYDNDLQRQRQYHNEQVPQYTPHSTSNNSRSNNDVLVNINDESERDATIIHTEQPPYNQTNTTNNSNNNTRNNNQPLQNPFEG
ncbi:unnamed protein product [Mucor hiemalis]